MERAMIRSSQWTALSLLLIVQTISSMSTYTVTVVTPFLENDWNFTRTQIGALTSAVYFGAFMVSIPAGWISDKFNVKKITIISVIVIAISMTIFPFTSTFLLSLIVMITTGLGYGILNPTSTQALVHWFEPKTRGTAIAIKQTGVTMGAGFSALFISYIIAQTGSWENSFFWISIMMLLTGLCFFLFYHDLPKNETQKVENAKQNSLVEILKNRNVIFGSLASMILAGIQFTFAAHFVLYLTNDSAIPFALTVMVVFTAQLVGSVGKVSWGLISDFVYKGKRKGVFLSICLLSSITTAGFELINPNISVFFLLLLVSIFGFTALGYAGIYMTYLAESSDESQIGTALGIGMMFMYIGILLFPPIIGWIADASGSYRYIWIGLSGLAIVASILLTFTSEPSNPTDTKVKKVN